MNKEICNLAPGRNLTEEFEQSFLHFTMLSTTSWPLSLQRITAKEGKEGSLKGGGADHITRDGYSSRHRQVTFISHTGHRSLVSAWWSLHVYSHSGSLVTFFSFHFGKHRRRRDKNIEHLYSPVDGVLVSFMNVRYPGGGPHHVVGHVGHGRMVVGRIRVVHGRCHSSTVGPEKRKKRCNLKNLPSGAIKICKSKLETFRPPRTPGARDYLFGMLFVSTRPASEPLCYAQNDRHTGL